MTSYGRSYSQPSYQPSYAPHVPQDYDGSFIVPGSYREVQCLPATTAPITAIPSLPTATAPTKRIVLVFGATWCDPCKEVAPTIADLEKDGLTVWHYDADRDKAVFNVYSIKQIPAAVVIEPVRDGRMSRVVARIGYESLKLGKTSVSQFCPCPNPNPNPKPSPNYPPQPGPKGDPGPPGKDGRDGVDGKPGSIGPIGLTGANGKDGQKGDKGDKGDPGPAGTVDPTTIPATTWTFNLVGPGGEVTSTTGEMLVKAGNKVTVNILSPGAAATIRATNH
jgi:thiol-disulfide isomerase/thioredoxin